VAGGDDPAALDSGGAGGRALTVGHDEHAVPLAPVLRVVDDLGGGVEVSTSASDPLGVHVASLLPFEGIAEVCCAVEGEDGDRDLLREGGEFVEEEGELAVIHASGLVDGDEELGDVATLDAGVDVGVALVDTLDGGGAFTAGDVTDELAENVAPVDELADRAADLFAEFGGDVAPSVRLGVGVLRGLLHHAVDLRGDHLLLFIGQLVPGRVVIEGVEAAEGVTVGVRGALGVVTLLAFLLNLVLELLEVPLRGLPLGEVSDELGDGHGGFLLRRPLATFGTGREDAWHEATGRQCHVRVAGDDRVDGEVRRHVPHLRRLLAAGREVAEDEVVELVGEDATDLLVAHRPEELRVPVQGDVVELRVEGHRRRGHVEGGRLPDVPAQFRKERRVLEERDEVPVQVEVCVRVAEHRYILSQVVYTLHRSRKKISRER